MKHITITTQLKDIEDSNLVFFFQNLQDIQKLQFLGLHQEIEKKLKKIFKEKKEIFLPIFLGNKKFEFLYVLYSPEKDTEKCISFLGKELSKIAKNYTLFIDSSFHRETLFDTALLSHHRYQEYKSEKIEKKVYIFCSEELRDETEQRLSTLKNIILARNLGEMPPNELTPEFFVSKIKSMKWKNTKIKILSPKDIEKKGLGLIQAVGKGSENKPYMVILERIVDKKFPTYGLVGKGVTFDTGGNQIKPGDLMYDMKGDMGGAAVSLALLQELDTKELNINIICCLCLAENVVSGSSYKPSDIIKGYTGKTVEIIHTDAEGRLVLADGISYISKNYNIDTMVSIATLTGAVVVALGYRYAGIMGDRQDFIQKVLEYSQTHTEKYIQLPFDDHFISKTKSEIADYKNLDRATMAGSSMGAAFLSNFVENGEKFVHIDIAGTYINSGEPYGKNPKGMTGFGVDSLSSIFQTLS